MPWGRCTPAVPNENPATVAAKLMFVRASRSDESETARRILADTISTAFAAHTSLNGFDP